MDVQTAIKTRRSIRSYKKNTPVEKEKLELILEAGRLAPSARNQQSWNFLVVKNKETLKKLAIICDQQDFVAEANFVILLCATNVGYRMSCGEYAYAIDLSIAGSFMMLQATELDLGSCWLGAYNQPKIKSLLRIPDDINVVGILTFGYPHFIPSDTGRKELNEVATIENFMQPYQ